MQTSSPNFPVAKKNGRPHPRRPQKVVRPEPAKAMKELATRSRRRAPPTIVFWASLINREFAAALILSIETLDCRVTFRDIAHCNEPKAARLAGFAIHNQFDFRNSAERLKEFPQCAFCYVKGKISDVILRIHYQRNVILTCAKNSSFWIARSRSSMFYPRI